VLILGEQVLSAVNRFTLENNRRNKVLLAGFSNGLNIEILIAGLSVDFSFELDVTVNTIEFEI